MELLMWLEQLYLWQVEREHPKPKQERPESEASDNEPSEVVYPSGYPSVLRAS